MTDKYISLADALDSINGYPGLVFGPLATIYPKTYSLIVENSVNQMRLSNLINEQNISAELEKLKFNDPDKANELIQRIYDGLEKVSGTIDVQVLAKTKWSLCISLTQDLLFESAIQNYQDSLPSSRTVTIIDHPNVRPQSRTIPIYKLLGNHRNKEPGHSLSMSESELLIRKTIWKKMLSNCADFLQGGPLLFFGTDTVVELVKTLLSDLLAINDPAPKTLLFLKNDPILENATIRSLCTTFSSVKIIDANIREFINALNELRPKQDTLRLTIEDTSTSNFEEYSAIISKVPNSKISEDQFLAHRQSLINSLFRPTVIDWDPYLCDIDLKRDGVSELQQEINDMFSQSLPRNDMNIIVRGDAGVGKTTMLKRSAIELSKNGYICLWCRKAPMDNWLRSYKKIAQKISEPKNNNEPKAKYVFFVDDYWSLRLDPDELISCFSGCNASILFVFSIRNSDYFSGNWSYNRFSFNNKVLELSALLSQGELRGLANMLLRIGATSSIDESEKIIREIPTKNSDDVLCSLWYLVPETRTKLADSLKDEYHRLGEARDFITDFAHRAQISGVSAQHAYEFVCVTSKFQIGLPMEVLVRALSISYEEFIDMAIDGKPLWGLIYDEEDAENGTIVYRMRNEVVTNILLELVNGGVGHAGEFRNLKILLSSCDIGSKVYRDFAVEILVRSSKDLERNFTYEQGLELYQIAQQTLPYEDRLLAFHEGIWMHKKGKLHSDAYRQFEKALTSQEYPDTERESPIEFIHTSMAAAVVALVKDSRQDLKTGFQLVQEHIQQASSPKIFNAHNGHVSANLLFEMAQQQSALEPNSIAIPSFSAALRVVELTLQGIGPGWRNNTRTEKSLGLLHDLQRRIVETIPNDEQLESYVYKIFEDGHDQQGFVLFLRRQLSRAQMSDKGSAYNSVKDSIEKVIAHIEKENMAPAIDVIDVRVDLLIRWRLQKKSGKIDWELFQNDLQIVLRDPRNRDNIIKNFYLAVALFHLGKIESSNAIFANLRRIQAFGYAPAEIRCFALGPEGFLKRFQCLVNNRHGKSFATINEINTDIIVLGSGRERANHTYIGFSLNGPVAIFNKPDEGQILLA